MTSHFGIVVVDSNKRGENEALNDEEKRQMYAARLPEQLTAHFLCRCLDIETWLVEHSSEIGAAVQVRCQYSPYHCATAESINLKSGCSFHIGRRAGISVRRLAPRTLVPFFVSSNHS
jgi:hypothetical protein